MAPFEALYGRRCRTPLCWFQEGESVLVGPKLIQQTTEKLKLIQERMKASQSRQKSYVDKRRRPLEFAVGDHIFLRVTPITGISKDIRSRKLSPRKYVSDPSYVLEVDDMHVIDDLLVDVLPIGIVESQMKQLRRKTISLIKVVWDKRTGDSTWELEGVMSKSNF
ncbi:uncharacterized protein LOC124820701 [Vigna umbellata]|uniref:uncharacterized protein LOC124820701 n=1 Tax=Vigna umbellata TaxID=87088 RepID=UPI001F5FE808|nr:uncharacterized protein LOC124820701 [Vigna umbellata]